MNPPSYAEYRTGKRGRGLCGRGEVRDDRKGRVWEGIEERWRRNGEGRDETTVNSIGTSEGRKGEGGGREGEERREVIWGTRVGIWRRIPE